MNWQPPKCKTLLDIFWYWVRERHDIYSRRAEGKPWPWTNDPILQTYRFTNVYRELDKVTQEIHEWYAPYAEHKNLWFALCLARYINWPPTLQAVGFPKTWKPEKVITILQDIKDRGKKVFTGAYIVHPGHEEPSKIKFVVNHVLQPLWGDRGRLSREFLACHSLEWACKTLAVYPGWGMFMAYEVISDLRHTRYLGSATDIYTWANAGPGAQRGLNRLCGRPLNHHVPPEQACKEMQELLQQKPFFASSLPRMEMRDIEHSLCEFFKYTRVLYGEGRPRALYHRDGSAATICQPSLFGGSDKKDGCNP